jgi:hypothetical protein
MGCTAMTRRLLVGLIGAFSSDAARGSPPLPAVIRPQDWTGFDVSGNHDNASIFQAMSAQIPATGGMICFPAGRIATSAACSLPGLTTVTGQGEPTEIICLPSFAPKWAIGPRAVFINRAWATGGGEVGITVRDLRLTGETGPAWGDAHFINMVNVKRVRVDRVTSSGWGNCTALTSCEDTEVSNCIAENISNCAFDHWGGAGWLRVSNNFAGVISGAAGSFGVMVTGLQTDGTPGKSGRAIILGNQVEVIDGSDPVKLGSCIEVNAGDDTGACTVRDVIIGDNICVVKNGATHRGIHLAQAVSSTQIRGNILRGGRFGPAITSTGTHSAYARDCLIEGNIIADWMSDTSQGSPIAWWGASSTIINNRGTSVSAPFVNSKASDPSNTFSNNRAT